MDAPQAARRGYAQGRLESLDLLRGIAATAVLVYHSENFLGVQLLPRSYLAVDLFFVLSGFVIAHNYDRRLAQGMTTADFMVQRLIRLYPCYALAFAFTFALGAFRMAHVAGRVDAPALALAGALNAVLLPAFNRPYGVGVLFPFNGASWSIFFELVANLLYCWFFRLLNARTLAFVVALSGVVLGVAATRCGTIDLGMRPGDFAYGFPRVLFSFFAGVAIRRYVPGGSSTAQQGARVALLGLVVVALFAGTPLLPGLNGQLFCVLVVMPLLVVLASRIQVEGGVRRFSTWAGDSSYPVYLLQGGFFLLFAAVPQALHRKSAEFTPWIGVALVATTVGVSLAVDRYFELPIRTSLKRRWQASRRGTSARSTA